MHILTQVTGQVVMQDFTLILIISVDIMIHCIFPHKLLIHQNQLTHNEHGAFGVWSLGALSHFTCLIIHPALRALLYLSFPL